MCGIAGLMNRTGEPVSRDVLQAMTRVLAHRGPDGEGIVVDGPLGLGHRRLAVLDLSPAGAQPMAGAGGRYWITYNGELYNFRDLRAELETLGHRFVSRSDTEVVLAAYAQWGPRCLDRFNGMFAFALWDRDEQTLWLVRDRLGVKPLFYAEWPGGFAFASEIKGLLPALPSPPALDDEALHHFLSLNYTPAPLTLFRGVRQLPPGHHLTVHRDGTTRLTAYWDLDGTGRNGRETQARLEELLADAVRLRLVSDVEVGAFLSGGLDSSVIVALMQRQVERPVRTFTAIFREASYDEGAGARRTASSLGTLHAEQLMEHTDLRLLPKLVWHSEELTADASMLALYRLAERARRDLKVVLAGDGADELFGGYPTYLATQVAGWYRHVPAVFRERLVRPLIERLPLSERKASLESQLRRFVRGTVDDPMQAHASWRTIFSEPEQRALLGRWGDWPPTASLYAPYFERTKAWALTNRLLYADLRFYLPNDMLVKVDRMTMAWGLEARTPYLDYRLVEFVLGLPARVKCGWGLHGKRLLRRAARGLLPRDIRRRAKSGFNIPSGRWLRREQRAFVEQHLLDARPTLFQAFDRGEIERLVRAHVSARADHSHQLWSLLCLSLWGQQFLDGCR